MEKLQVEKGDKVILSHSWHGQSVVVVDNITPKGNIRASGILFDEYGTQKGGDTWSRYGIKKADEESIRKISEEKYVNKVFKMIKDCKKLTYSQAIEIDKILSESEDTSCN